MSITPELQDFLAHPQLQAQLQAHADRLRMILDEVPASRQGALVRFLEGLTDMDGGFPAESVLAAAEKWPSIVGPFARETGLTLAMARFCHEHPHQLSAWLIERGLDEQLLQPWVSRWLRGQAVLEKLRHANNMEIGGGKQ